MGIGLASSQAFADPPCLYNNQALSFNNTQVLYWKTATPNGWLGRAYIEGVSLGVFADQTGHAHFLVQIGQTAQQDIEIVYNLQFGALPQIQPGMQVRACGDFINSNAVFNGYPASPAGAIIHWVHENPSQQGHPNGFLIIDNVLYGDAPGQM
jgi:hypothetical protein